MPTLMVSVSGIRGIVGDGLGPNEIVKYASAYAEFCGKGKIIIGRDARITGEMVKNILIGTLSAKGNEIIDIGICPTPTVLYNVKLHNAVGGIAISASHNPNEWNALKLLNDKGEFMTAEENKIMLEKLDYADTNFCSWDNIGKISYSEDELAKHVEAVLKMKYIDVEAIKKRKFKVLLDSVNGAGGYVMPELLEKFGCEVIKINCEKTGIFPRKPEPVPENLIETFEAVKNNNVDLGIVVDPDVDRLVLVTDKGEPFGEENTIVQAVKFVLSKQGGNAVVNLSTTRGVDDVVNQFGGKLYRSPVGEANVVAKMKKVDAVIGGEGSGGVIFPALHYGRDALVGTAIILQHLLEYGKSISEMKDELPQYFIYKTQFKVSGNPDGIINKFIDKYSDEKIITDDGLRIDFDDHWVHFRKSNTEPIIRCIIEAAEKELAINYSKTYSQIVKEMLN